MTAPFFYSKEFLPDQVNVLDEETSRHIIQVLRMKKGEHLNVTNGMGYLFYSEISSTDKKKVSVQILKTDFNPPAEKRISLAVSLLKNTARFEWFLEKATETGISQIIPLICKRTEKSHFRADRMNNIIISAMLQSQQTWLPILMKTMTVSEFINQDQAAQKFIAHCENAETKTTFSSCKPFNDTSVMIGPEGDFTPEEIELSIQGGYTPVSLGKNRLRSETAALMAVSILNFC